MKYGKLPFDRSTSKGVFLGEPIAPSWKRLVSALIDYGWIAIVIYVTILPPRYCYEVVPERVPGPGVPSYVSPSYPRFGNPDCFRTGQLSDYIVIAVIAVINSVIVPHYTAQSCGRYLTKTSLVFPKHEKRFELAGYFRLAIRLVVSCVVPVMATYLYVTVTYYAFDPTLDSVAIVSLAMMGLYAFPNNNNLNRRLPPDGIGRTVVLARPVKFAPSGRMLPKRLMR